MSRVTIEGIYYDLFGEIAPEEGLKIEVVPRKMVEMIMEYCLEDYKCMSESQGVDQYANGICVEAIEIRNYARSLLKQFEEGVSK